ncbi:S1 family peptidase [Streptomyces fuscigenes]|uniref:S1 family peptidase n=1 Tax=Streptomyces fuscigenes TaxID=1528880 RepID=UPI001F37525B|nr:S1 family peptidase [Streptomyces fuscigenes]MCF3964266.1 S1 family peptidase [Streptomyces fuscigenes]
MQYRHVSTRRARLAGAGALALTATAVLVATGPAHAGPTLPGPPGPEGLSAASAGSLAARFDDTSQGSFYDSTHHRLVVNVLDESAADTVRAGGATPRLVSNSLAELRSATATLRAKAMITGTSWVIDPKADKVVVTADRTVDDARLARLNRIVGDLGSRAVLERTASKLSLNISGGDAIWGDGARCSLGFNVVKGGDPYFLTAGHCGKAVKNWSDTQNGAQIAQTESATFPTHDYSLVKYTATVAHPSDVDLYNGSTQPITKAGTPLVGQTVERSGSTTKTHTGEVTGLDATVNYEEGTVSGLIKTSVCAEPGDSGGPLFDGSTALGLTSGGSGNCTSGGETFFQPVPAALTALGAEIG